MTSAPEHPEAEAGVLGSLLIAPHECLHECRKLLVADDFYQARHKLLFPTILDYFAEHDAADIVLITNLLRDRKQLEAVGGPAYITSLIDYTPTAANLGYYIDLVVEKARLRTLWKVSRELHHAASNPTADLSALAAETGKMLSALTAGRQSSHKSIKELVASRIDAYEQNATNPNAVRDGVIPTGIDKLDAWLTGGGLRPSRFIVVKAATSIGKTALSFQFGIEGAVRQGKRVLIVSYEMEAEELVDRAFSSLAGISGTKLVNGTFSDVDLVRITKAAGELSDSGLIIRDDVGHWTVDDVANEARYLHANGGLGLVVVDYLQLVRARPTANGQRGNREQDVAAMSSTLKKLAKELRIPVIAPSQVNKGGDSRESQAIEFDADIVLSIHEKFTADGQSVDDERDIVIEKQRGGARDKRITVSWDAPCTKFG